MAFISKTTLTKLAATIFLFGTLTAGQKFADTCVSGGCKLNGTVFGCMCFDHRIEVAGYDWGTIDLNLCLGNNGGSLVPWDNGGALHSCDSCSLELIAQVNDPQANGTAYLHCDCWNTNNKKSASKLDLNTVISNDDGHLRCFGHNGDITHEPKSNTN